MSTKNDITLITFRFFDTGKSSAKLECFYHELEGIPSERIKTYGFAFEGKNVLIG